ncbi:OmpA family protein [Lacihabitans soyangensis]|nr:OmpA family protein [Lacihabitans soyangensis]
MSNFLKKQSASFFAKNNLILLLFLLVTASSAFSQKVNIKGSFWDDSNGVDLKTQVYGIKDGQKIHLAETDTKNLFDFKLPTDIQALIFESAGYDVVTFPVHFVGRFNKTSLANFSISSKGVFYQLQFKDLLIFCLPITHQKGNKYKLLTVRKDTIFRNMDFTILVENKQSTNYPIFEKSLRNQHKVLTTNAKNEIIQEDNFLANRGLTFVDINTYPTEIMQELDQQNVLAEISEKEDKTEPSIDAKNNLPYSTFGSRNLYFDQSKFELKSENKLVLDSLSWYLQQKLDARINITGFTDNVGKEELNATLARYRAQVVATYLKSKGVHTNQLLLKSNTKQNIYENHNADVEKQRKVQLTEIY